MSAILRKLGWFWWGMIALGVVVLVCGVFLVVQYATAASVGELTPADGAVVAHSDVEIAVGLPGFVPGDAQLELLLDGEPVDPSLLRLAPDLVSTSAELADGRHVASIHYSSTNAFSSRLVCRWAFIVDTTPPVISVVEPSPHQRFSMNPSPFRVELDEPALVTLTVDGVDVPLTQGENSAFTSLALAEGMHDMRVQAVDGVGNSSDMEWKCFADYQPPRMEMHGEPADRVKDTSVVVEFTVHDNIPRGLSVFATLDETPLPIQDVALAEGLSEAAARSYRVDTGEISEGLHTLIITAKDWGDHTATYSKMFTVDSTGLFGARSMRHGAIGEDVRQLQRLLKDQGFYKDEINGYFDGATVAAVRAYRLERGLPDAAGVDMDMLRALVGRIVIDRSDCTLTLYDEKGVVKNYSCAVGMAAYPTPLGSFQIINKIYHPTWSPPPSPWAEKLEPVPPGVGNPLGTRWMGLTAPYVGIHGTYESWSIGRWASHGCIRMYISDVEELFELVHIGTPVDIVR
ncbi:MAG: murein L,D-transpeptidase [Actinobacteria bacterium]|nr:murein L,D-transpeptidase [Actinomycetota bacterium]